jgi:hypothetical protein
MSLLKALTSSEGALTVSGDNHMQWSPLLEHLLLWEGTNDDRE